MSFNISKGQKLFSKNDYAIIPLEVAAGYAQGWRDEVIYHPNALFKHFPNLPKKFWDNRIQSKPGFLHMEWNADHVLKATTNLCHLTAICFKIGERKKFKYYLFDMLKYYISYQTGFFLSYNLTHKNKI